MKKTSSCCHPFSTAKPTIDVSTLTHHVPTKFDLPSALQQCLYYHFAIDLHLTAVLESCFLLPSAVAHCQTNFIPLFYTATIMGWSLHNIIDRVITCIHVPTLLNNLPILILSYPHLFKFEGFRVSLLYYTTLRIR